ncbi:MAG: ATP-binding cassette domain-containing protein, partial [Spirochaetia bacterium]|nr:ATP-binding cassette domain-containing protein [Spirochaetia bacterium]
SPSGLPEDFKRMKQILQIQNLSKHYGPAALLDQANLVIHEGQKIGVIGRNGAGKSTLFNILTDRETADSGIIHCAKDLRLGYLEQKDPFHSNETSLEYLMRVSQKEDWLCGKTAGRMQIKNDVLKMKASSLPGGFQMRLRLSAMLITDPDFILLDEPTNYLDLKTLLILENFLGSFRGGFMIISHDREFLKKTCSETLEIKNGKLNFFPGNIEEYFAFEEEQNLHIERVNKGIEAKQKELNGFIEKFRAKASKASQARSKEKQLNRLHKIEAEQTQRDVKIRIPEDPSPPGKALQIENLSIGYNQKAVASGISHIFSRGEHVAVLGDNGEGKSTLLKTLAGEIPPVSGNIKWANGRNIGYYAQHVFQSLIETDTVLDHLKKISKGKIPEQSILDLAGSFLFQGDEIHKKISVLSGGERSRLILAGLLLSGSNVFLFDEPTNHLDFETVEALAGALKQYGGTVFFISHDRTFVNILADAILEIRDGSISLYRGNYEDYVFALESRIQEESPDPDHSGNNLQSEKIKTAYHLRKEIQSGIRKNKSRSEKIEKEIHTLEEKQKEKISKLSESYSMELNDELVKINSDLESCETEWMSLQEELETLEKALKQ